MCRILRVSRFERKSRGAARAPGFPDDTRAIAVFDLETKQWTTLPAASHIPPQRAGAGAVVMNGKLIVLGGEGAPSEAQFITMKPLSDT
jgi:hypothetical protein